MPGSLFSRRAVSFKTLDNLSCGKQLLTMNWGPVVRVICFEQDSAASPWSKQARMSLLILNLTSYALLLNLLSLKSILAFKLPQGSGTAAPKGPPKAQTIDLGCRLPLNSEAFDP